ncbi:hypothetical protein V4F39_05985 [Aquincola sp. MAHUQ-54]|uniref:protein O-GlcNAc transferase n=1 Tax=Aquincola agrisoli TaxID=3119538 RepID=A0AAW9Q3A3_9BURK
MLARPLLPPAALRFPVSASGALPAAAPSRTGGWQEAEALLSRMTGHPHFGVEQWVALASARNHLNQVEGAAEAARRAVALDPHNLKAVHVLTTVLMRQNQFTAALELFEQHREGEAREHYQFVSNHATALAEAGRHADAVPVYLEAMVLCVRDPAVHMKLGLSLKEMKLFEEAAESFLTAVTLEPGRFAARVMVQHLRQYACAWGRFDEDRAQLIQALQDMDPDPASARGEGAVWALTALDVPQPLFLKAARQVAQRCAFGAEVLPRNTVPAAGERRVRVGYVSADFHSHATSLLMVEALERRDRSRFEVVLYSHGKDDGSAAQQRVRAACDRFVDMTTMSLGEMARGIHADGIDILVDLKGQTFENRLGVFAYRPAPIQVAFLGFPGTCGASYIDYIIGDRHVTPLAHAAHFSEHIAQMPNCYQPNDSRRLRPEPHRRMQWGLPEDAVIFGNFNQSFKLSPETFDAWVRILKAVPGSLLWMLADNLQAMRNIEREAAARGLEPGRIRFAPRVGVDEHLARLPVVDFMLDNWPCSAHTTASDALWMGVPIVTMMGESFASRVAGSLLHDVGLGELACTDIDAYEAAAIALARDRGRLQALRRHLDEGRDGFALFDGARFARDLEALYERMLARERDGLPPAHLPA